MENFGLTSLPAQLLTILFAGIGVAYWFGYGASRWLLPRELAPYRWLLMPAVGMTMFAVIVQPLARVGLVTAQWIWILFPLAFAANALALWRAPQWENCARREIFLPLAVAVGALILGTLPLFAYGYLTVVGYNVDGSTYVAQAEIAKQYGLALEQIDALPLLYAQSVAHIIRVGVGAAAPLWISLVSQLLGRDSFYAYAPLSALGFAFSFLSVFVLYRVGFGLKFWTSVLVLVALALHSAVLSIPLDNFVLHTFVFMLLPLAWLAAQNYFQTPTWRALVLAALSLGAVLLTYPEAAPFYFAPLALCVLLALRRGRATFWQTCQRALVMGVVSLVLAPTAYWTLAANVNHQTRTLLRAVGGTVTEFISLPEGFGFAPLRVWEYEGVTAWMLPRETGGALAWLGVAASLILLGSGLIRSWRARRDLFFASGATMLFWLAWMFWIQNYPYGFFKTFATSAFVLFALLGFGIETWVEQWRGHARARRFLFVPALLTAFLFLLLGMTMVWYQTMLAQRPPVVTRRLIQLSNSNLIPSDSSLFLSLSPQHNPRMYWAAYFFRARPVYGSGVVAYFEIHNAQQDVVYDYALLNRDENPAEFGYAPDAVVWEDRWTVLYEKR